ncbi:MAG: TssN family type VI secretion system protein [Bacteroidota bacterium]
MDNRFIIIILFVVALVIFSIILKNRKLKGSTFISLLYIIVTGVILGAGGFLGNKGLLTISLHLVFILLSIWMLVLGILHTLFLKKMLPWCKEDDVYWTEFFFTVVIALFGGIFLLLAFYFSKQKYFTGIYLTSLLAFILPYIFYGTLKRYIEIPVKIFRKWHYPVDQHVEDPLDREMESPLVVGFEFKKRSSDKNMTSFRAKAPKEMAFGKLFYYFINDYNDRNPDEKIEFLNEKNKPVGWIFYFKPKMFSSIRYIDPEETNSFNFIKENSVIICKRVIEK